MPQKTIVEADRVARLWNRRDHAGDLIPTKAATAIAAQNALPTVVSVRSDRPRSPTSLSTFRPVDRMMMSRTM